MQAFVDERREEGREDETFLTDFLQEVALYSDLDKADDGSPKVSLMTIHAAKGLEFPVVFVVGLEENIFPNAIAASRERAWRGTPATICGYNKGRTALLSHQCEEPLPLWFYAIQ